MIFRGTESFQYPSRKDFRNLGEIMEQVRTVDSQARLSSLTSAVTQLIPHQFSACGTFNIRKCALQIGHSSYGDEFAHLYATQGFVVDPSIRLLQTTRIATVSSEDSPDLAVPREVTSLKLDFGIRTCLSVGVRGMFGACTYFAFSNFDQKQLWKLRTVMQILAPHFHLAYSRATARPERDEPFLKAPDLTPREEEIMRWVAEGKTNWEISIILGVSLNTVKFHLKNVYQKLGGVENRWTAVAHWQWNSAGLTIPDSHKYQRESKPSSRRRLLS